MAKQFKPNKRQRNLVAKAESNAKKASLSGHHAPSELVHRMTSEERANHATPGVDAASPRPVEPREFHFVLAAAVDDNVTSESVLRQPGMQGCSGVSVFTVPRRIVLMEFTCNAASADDAVRGAAEGVLQAYPGADFFDPNDADYYVDEFVEVTTGQAPSAQDVHRILHCRAPSDDALLLAANLVDGLVESLLPEGPAPRGTLRYVEGEVFEVMPALRLAHLQTLDGRMFGMLASTPGIGAFDQIEEGQRYVMLVGPRFNLVLHAERLD